MSYEVYKVIHLLGIMLLFTSLGAMVMLYALGGPEEQTKPYRKLLSALHGVSLLIILVAGGGLMARKGIMGVPPPWLSIKIVIWLALGGALVLLRKVPDMAKVWLVALPVVGTVAAYLASTHG